MLKAYANAHRQLGSSLHCVCFTKNALSPFLINSIFSNLTFYSQHLHFCEHVNSLPLPSWGKDLGVFKK